MRGKNIQLCVTVQWMSLQSSPRGAVLHDGSSTGSATARFFSGRNLQSTVGNISRSQPLQSMCQERKKSGKETGTMSRRQVIGTKALQWILLWIWFGVKTQTVEALEEGIPAHQEMESGLSTALFPRGVTRKVTENCDEEWKEGENTGKKKKVKTAREGPKDLQKKTTRKGPKHL